MIASPTLQARPGHRPPFLAWGWAMLMVVLLHAAPTGQVGMRVLGSAFDPTTTAVALSPKRSKIVAAAKTEANRDPVAESAAAPAVKLSVASAPSQSFIVTPVAPAQPYAVATLPERLLTRPVGTRAPPAN